jgi:hypothetical protein
VSGTEDEWRKNPAQLKLTRYGDEELVLRSEVGRDTVVHKEEPACAKVVLAA